MKFQFQQIKRTAVVVGALAAIGGMMLAGVAQAATTPITVPTAATTHASAGLTTAQQQDLTNIVTKGNEEIDRRLTSLNALSSEISGTTKLSASDQASLSSEVNTEITGLTNLKTQLDSETTVAAARTDAQNIINEYRVYALVLPKVWLIKTSDDQQVVEGKLTTLAQKLQSRITADQTAGKDVASLQTELNDMTTKINDAQSISSSIEQSVLALQPSDYNSDHSILSGDGAQLQTAHSDNTAAYNDAKSIISSLSSL